MSALEQHFESFRKNILGIHETIDTVRGHFPLVYADWIASGRCYGPIEDLLQREIYPVVGNTHTETSYSGTLMTKAYKTAKKVVKRHVNADAQDVLIFFGSGMTAAVNKLQRILGLRVPQRFGQYLPQKLTAGNGPAGSLNPSVDIELRPQARPVIFVTPMEHHSNHTSWLETIADVETLRFTAEGDLDLDDFRFQLSRYADREMKIAAVTAASNVTGIITPYHEIARIIHRAGGWCFVDFACSAPYVRMDMHPEGDPEAALDAIYFSPHKFLGGPGTPGVLIFSNKLYQNSVPDHPGGGTVTFTNPWKFHDYIQDIEEREDGGTPPFLQGIKTALAVRLKEQMGVDKILAREHELLEKAFHAFETIPGAFILAGHQRNRVGVISFNIEGLHYNLGVRLLNDHFGIQMRGGCACAGTYGHYLLGLDEDRSRSIFEQIQTGDQTSRPGWIRLSLHPTLTDAELDYILNAIRDMALHWREWALAYAYDSGQNEWICRTESTVLDEKVQHWFTDPF